MRIMELGFFVHGSDPFFDRLLLSILRLGACIVRVVILLWVLVLIWINQWVLDVESMRKLC